MTRLVDRETREDVADLLVRYAAGIDRRDWKLLRSCFTDDCVADYGTIGKWSSGDEITEWMRRTHEPLGPVYAWGPLAGLRASGARTRVRVTAALSKKVFGSDRSEGSSA